MLADPKQFKLIILDVALTQALLGTASEAWTLTPEKAFINKGAIIEAVVGQNHWLTLLNCVSTNNYFVGIGKSGVAKRKWII